MFAPPGIMSRAFWGLIQGWLTVWAWVCTVSQPAYFLATLIQGMVILNHDEYIVQRWHGTLIAWGVLAIPVSINILARRVLPTIEVMGAITHISFFIVFVVTLAVLAPRSPASFVFGTNVFGLSGWENQTVQWCIGLISATFPLGGFDGVLHMSKSLNLLLVSKLTKRSGDEVKDASKKVPLAMVYSVTINGIMAFAFMITVLFCLGDFETALTTPTGYPIIQVVYGATGSKAATTAMTCFIFFNGLVSMFSSLASVSRLTWAFARDKGLPFSNFIGAVNPTFRIPLNALGLVSTIVALLQIINIGSSTAFYAIVGLSTIGLYLSYVLPILFIALAKIRGDRINYGPFKLGRTGLAINIFAVVYGIYMIIFLPFPPYMPVTAVNMNYTGPILLFVIMFALADWFISGKKRFVVPADNVSESY